MAKRSGTLLPAGTWPDGTLRYRCRLRLGDGTKSDRIDLVDGDGNELHFADEKQARELVEGMQRIEDATEEFLSAKRAKAARSGAPPAAAGETCDAWYVRFTAYRREIGRTTATGRWRRWISPRIGPKPIAAVTRDDIEDIRDELDAAIRAWLAEGKGGKRIAGKTAMNVWSALTTAFKAATTSKARHLRVREDNPCVGVEPPGDRDSRKARRKTFLYPKEAAALFACADVPLVWRECHAIAAYTYLRPGELRVLTWSDVDLDAALVSVTKAWDYRASVTKTPKTRNGVRRVPLEPALVPLLRRMREGTKPDALVVPILSTFRGGRAAEDQLAIVFRRHLEAAEVKRAEVHATTATHVRANFRSWRDSGLTWLAMTGLGVDKISRRAGHDMIQTTMGYVKQAEDLTGDLGAPFAPLPDELVAGVESVPRPSPTPPIGPAIGPNRPNAAEGLYRRRDSKLDGVSASTTHREVSSDEDATTRAEVREHPSDATAIGPAIGPTAAPAVMLSSMDPTLGADPIEDALALGMRAIADAIGRARAEDLPLLAERAAVLARELEARRIARSSNVVAMPIAGPQKGRR